MTGLDAKADLLTYLQGAREVLLWKLDGLGEYDIRRPLTPTGTNLLGLVKHSASMELEYFGPVFGRPHGVPLRWLADDAERNADLWATPEQSREEITGLYRRAWQHADETIAALPLDAAGRVPWWGDDGTVTLQHVLVHMTAETQRHAGHADIVREMIDGAAGLLKEADNLPAVDEVWWRGYRERVDQAARDAAGMAPLSLPPQGPLLAHEHQGGFPLKILVRLAADVDRDPVNGAAGEPVGRRARIVLGDGLARVFPHVQAASGDREGAELGLDPGLAYLAVRVIDRQHSRRAVGFLALLVERGGEQQFLAGGDVLRSSDLLLLAAEEVVDVVQPVVLHVEGVAAEP